MRPFSQIPAPAEVLLIAEGRDSTNSHWNNWIGQDAGFNYGFHGELRKHMYSFVDGHAGAVEFSVRTNVTSVQADSVTRGAAYQLRGSDTEYFPVSGGNSSCGGGAPAEYVFGPPSNSNLIAHLMWSGPDWRTHAFPAPAYDTGVCWQD
jgi:hypothetical protein